MKIICFSILIAVLTTCNNGGVVTLQDATINTSIADTLTEEYEESAMSKGGHVCVSENKRVSIESGVCSGGTVPEYWTIWTIVNEKGVKHGLRFAYTPYISEVHSLRKKNGFTYYIIDCFSKASSTDGNEWLEAYKIVGDMIKEVNVADGSEKIDNSEFDINYCIPNWCFTTNGAGYDWLFEYDKTTKKLYVPITEEQDILDRYQVWQFNGEHFVCLGEKPHKDMHKSLSKYNRLIRYMTTKDYIIRVDSLDSDELGYASWKKPRTMADKLDLVITGSKIRHHSAKPDELHRCDDYHFKSGN